jgi:hypothetical protein
VDKSKCKASNCTTCIKGKNATNLMNHLVSKHKEHAAAVEKRGSTCAGSVVSTSFRSLCGARIFCLWGPENGKEKQADKIIRVANLPQSELQILCVTVLHRLRLISS